MVQKESSIISIQLRFPSAQSHGAGKKSKLSLLVISGMCGTDRWRGIPILFIPAPVLYSWVSCVWEDGPPRLLNTKRRRSRRVSDAVGRLEHVLAFIGRIT